MVTSSRTAIASIFGSAAGRAAQYPARNGMNLLGRCGSDDDRCSRQAGFLGSRW
jgi:hypothetical protein